MIESGTTTTKAPFLTKAAKYAWADLFEVEMEEGAKATMTIRMEDGDLTLDIEDAPDLIALMQHALDSRESRR